MVQLATCCSRCGLIGSALMIALRRDCWILRRFFGARAGRRFQQGRQFTEHVQLFHDCHAEGAARSAPRDAKLRIAFAAALTKLGDAQLADISVPLATRIDNASQSYTKAGHIDGKNTAAKAGLEKIKALQAKSGAPKKRG